MRIMTRGALLCLLAATAGIGPVGAQDKQEGAKPSAKAKLPAPASEVLFAKDGGVMVVSMPSKRLLGIVDVAEKKLVKVIRVASTEFLFAAGGNRALVYDRPASVFSTYDLDDYSRVKSKQSPFTNAPTVLAMGSANAEFALVFAPGEGRSTPGYYKLDLRSLDAEPIEVPKGFGGYHVHGQQARLDPEGRMVAFGGNAALFGQLATTESGCKLTLNPSQEARGFISPLPNRGLAVTTTGQVVNTMNKVVKNHQGFALYPDYAGHFYIGVVLGRGAAGQKANVYSTSTHQVVSTLSINLPVNEYGMTNTPVLANSQHKVLTTLSQGMDELEFYDFDPIGDLKRSNLDYLIVMSNAPRQVKRGATLQYKVVAETNAKSFSVELMDGPEGAKVEGQVVRWAVPAQFKGDEAEFLLRLSNPNEDEVFHDFRVAVKNAE